MTIRFAAILLLCSVALAQTTPTDTLNLLKPTKAISLPTAGVTLELPAGFAQVPSGDADEVLSAVHFERREATRSLRLLLTPVNKLATAEAYNEALAKQIQSQLAIRHFKAAKPIPCAAAGIQGVQRQLSYQHRGTATEAIQACFLRTLPATANHPEQYLMMTLVVEMTPKRKEMLKPTFNLVIDSMALTPLQSPTALPFEKGEQWLRNPMMRTAVRVPKGWIAEMTAEGGTLSTIDYTRGGIGNPTMTMLAVTLAKEQTAKQLGDKAIEFEKKQGQQLVVLREQETKLAGKDALQYVIRQTVTPKDPKKAKRVYLLLRRLMVTTDPDTKEPMHYAVLLQCEGLHPMKAEQFMEQVCTSFAILSKPKPQTTPKTEPKK
jgi:hypothetical protein